MIELRNVSAGYNKKKVLNQVSVAFKKGKLTVIIGPNGSGKSTLLKTVIGVVEATEGEMITDGCSLWTLSSREIAKKIAFLSQGRTTPDMTVEQMVLHGRFPHLGYPRRYTKKDREIAKKAMEELKIAELAESPIHTLSGGMRQTAYIAMALAQDTEYILMDEPTTYLDISHQLELMRMLRTLADCGKGIVVVMHDLPLAFTFADEIVVLNNGKIMAHGDPEAVCGSGVVENVFGIELQMLDRDRGYGLKLGGGLVNEYTRDINTV